VSEQTAGRLARRVALVTGASRGIGRAICQRLAREGAAVAVNYASAAREAEAREVVTAIEAIGGTAMVARADVSQPDEVAAMVDEVRCTLGPIAILVNNAAVTRVHGPWTEIDPAGWDRVMATNAGGTFLCSRAVYPDMAAAGWGRVINIGSVTFLTGQANLAGYAASKGAVVGFTRALARSVGAEGITVNCVSPGAIRTEMELEVASGRDGELALEMGALQAVPRRGTAEDVASAVAFLAGDDASFITGQLLEVDGGLALH